MGRYQPGVGIIPTCRLAGTGSPEPRMLSSALGKCETPQFLHTTSLLLPSLPSHSLLPTLSGTSWLFLFLLLFWARFHDAQCSSSLPLAIFCWLLECFFNSVLATKLFSGLAMGFFGFIISPGLAWRVLWELALNLFF